jgi:hypothetical protein
MIGELIGKAWRKPHRIPHYLYWKMELLFLQYYYRIKLGTKTFEFRGSVYNYFCHRYNTTWKNERAVEVPIVWEIMKNRQGRILEVGNVLSHYHTVTHDIVDKYEKAKGVTNQDIVDFRPAKRYDLIVSISTMEHVGWDENPRESRKILQALDNLKLNCVASGGEIVITLPLGQYSELDRLLNKGAINLGKQYYLKRISRINEWAEVGWEDVWNVKYNTPFPNSNAIIICFWKQTADGTVVSSSRTATSNN